MFDFWLEMAEESEDWGLLGKLVFWIGTLLAIVFAISLAIWALQGVR